MNSSESNENMVFDYHVIRLLIGLIALSFPWIVSILAREITPSISWSYWTNARDIFVGLLFVMGGFCVSYTGHQPELDRNNAGKFWSGVSKFWKGAIDFRIWERKREEHMVSWVGGIAAGVTAVNPTSKCLGTNCPSDPTSTIHLIAAIILFSTTVYFCLVAFSSRANAKIKENELSGIGGIDPRRLRTLLYSFCGWGIVVIMLLSAVVRYTHLVAIDNVTFWAEAVALELFGIAWLVASQYLPVVTVEAERQKLFSKSAK